MNRRKPTQPPRRGTPQRDRQGAITVLSALLLIVVFGMVAFALDLGYIAVSKAQMQTASDAAALGSCVELEANLGAQPSLTTTQAGEKASLAAQAVGNANPNGGLSGTYLSTTRDVRYGQATWNPTTKTWNKTFNATPYNMVEITVRRDVEASNESQLGDRPLDTFFGGALGMDQVSLWTDATAALLPGIGVTVTPGSGMTADVLPIALDVPTWDALMAGTGTDQYSYNTTTGAVTSGGDGVKEVDLYPYGNQCLPSGNRGTVDLGSPNNSTNDLKRQILYGLNEDDLSYFGGELRTDNGPLNINGDTGISAGIKAELEQIKGQPRLIPLFTSVSGPGNNAIYVVPKFVPIRIMYVKLTGNPKKVVVQPATYVSSTVIRGGTTVGVDSYFTRPKLIE
jgi:Flp pilus assembly protein TadG